MCPRPQFKLTALGLSRLFVQPSPPTLVVCCLRLKNLLRSPAPVASPVERETVEQHGVFVNCRWMKDGRNDMFGLVEGKD